MPCIPWFCIAEFSDSMAVVAESEEGEGGGGAWRDAIISNNLIIKEKDQRRKAAIAKREGEIRGMRKRGVF